MTKDIRFVQRFNNFLKAFMQLESAISLTKERKLSDLEKQGLIQAFEYCHELAWNVLKDFLQNEEGKSEIYGSKSATREAFRVGLISNGEVWMEMIKDRNQTLNTYNSDTSEQIFNNIVKSYFAEFVSFKNKFKKLKEAAES
jgi:nucleotidyltransferase substrate binding protein (TIGR01987 family)